MSGREDYDDLASADAESGQALLASSRGSSAAVEVQDTTWWRFFHALGFATGGTTFIAGTACYYVNPQTDYVDAWAAALYIIGSIGFLSVDVMELFTPAYKACPLRFNILLSAIGSTLYVIGSAGYLPSVLKATEAVGVWGFILGSAFIGVSQAWKVARIATDPATGKTALATITRSAENFTACGVEANAGIGAWHFFVGTIMYAHATTPDAWMNAILGIWMAGSVFFTLGAAFLAYRHFVMRIS